MPQRSARVVLRSLPVVLAALVALWLTIAATVSAVLGVQAPDLSLGGLPPSAEIRAERAAESIAKGGPRQTNGALRDLAVATVDAPLIVKGFSSLGLMAGTQGRRAESRQLFLYAHTLSRRDAATELWMIEDRVAAHDIDGALRHYDHGLRTSKRLRTMLIPILVRAASEPLVAKPLGSIIARRPPWRIAFAEQFVGDFGNPATTSTLIRQLRLDPDEPRERAILVAAMARLVSIGAFEDAQKVWRHVARPDSVGRSLLIDGSFEQGGQLPPFAWQLVDEPGLAAVSEPRQGAKGRRALSLLAQSGRAGTVAKQLVLLKPGSYRLSGIAGQVPGDAAERPTVSLACAASPDQPVLAIKLPAGEEPRRFTGKFAITRGCPAQWLAITAAAEAEPREQPSWIDALAITRL